MKKQYINPEMEIVEVNAHQSLLAGSMKVYYEEVPGVEVLSPGLPGLPTLDDPFDVLDQFDLNK